MLNYHIEFEVAGLCLFVLLIVYYFSKKRANALHTKVFTVFFVLNILNIILDIVTVVILNKYNSNLKDLFYILNSVYLISQFILPAVFLAYSSILVREPTKKETKGFLILCIPALLGGLSVLIFNNFTGIFFYIEDNKYYHGSLHFLFYLNVLLYFIISIWNLAIRKCKNSRVKIMTLGWCLLIAFSFVIIQFSSPQYLLTGFGCSLITLILFLSFQNPVNDQDQLTGTMSRKVFDDYCKGEINKNRSFGIILVNIKNYRAINDMLSNKYGDEILRNIGKELMNISSKKSVYRYRGNVFAVAENSDLSGIFLKIKSRMNNSFINQGYEIQLQTQYFIKESPIEVKTLESFVSAIDYCLNETKNKPSNYTLYIDDAILDSLERKKLIEKSLQMAIDNRHFEVFYQPIFDIESNSFTSLEALARLNIPKLGYVSPEEFIRIAEQNGSIIDIGLLVLEEVCKFVKKTNIISYGIKTINVNLSMAQCMHDALIPQIMTILERYDLKYDVFDFEITETSNLYSEELLLKNMEGLIKNGVYFSLDDYGSGYSTTDYVLKFPFNSIKIDKEIIKTSVENEASHIILESTIKMFKKLGKKVVAEGVETVEMLKKVMELGTDYIQGYYYAKPMPANQLLVFFENKEWLNESFAN